MRGRLCEQDPQVNSDVCTAIRWEQPCRPGPKARDRSSALARRQSPSLGTQRPAFSPSPSCMTLHKPSLLLVPQFPHAHKGVHHPDSGSITSNAQDRSSNAKHTVGLQHRPMGTVVILPRGQPCTEMLPRAPPPSTTPGLCLPPDSGWEAVPISS